METAPAPKVAQAIKNFHLATIPFYFEGYYGSRLAPMLANRFKISEDHVSVGYGIEFFLRSIFDSCIPGRDIILTNAPHYGFYEVYAKARGVKLEKFLLRDMGSRFVFDIEDCLKKIRAANPKVILITSPNNPTGNSISPKDLGYILRATKKTSLVVLDEAYWGFDERYNEAAFLRLLKKYENLVILRSFSKRYALAGLRIGFALWGTRAKQLARYDDLYLGGSRLLEEVAVAALDSDAYYSKLASTTIADREKVIAKINTLQNFKAYDSNANFVLVKILNKNIKPETPISKFITPEFMRVSLGSRKHIVGFLKTLKASDLNYVRHS